MRIVMFTDAYWPRVNGVTVSVDSYSRALVKAGHEVMIICSSYPEASPPVGVEEGIEGLTIVRVPSMPAIVTKEDRLAKMTRWFWVFKQVEQFNPSVIHINTEMVIAEFGLLYARTHRLPAIYTFHTMWEDYGFNYFPMFPPKAVKFVIRKILKNILKRSYRVIVPTEQINEVVHRYKPRTKTFLLPTGIEMDLFDRSDEDSATFRERIELQYPGLKGKRILLYAGRVAKEKNISFLLSILPGILDKHPDIILLVVGNGPDLDYFKEEAKARGIGEACVFTGYMDRRDLALVYRAAEIFVFPSLTDTQGLVTLEAMLSGTPVVAIGALGTLMVMNGDNGGFMVKNDPVEFTGRVLELLDDRDLMDRKSLEAKDYASAWSIEELTVKLIDFYKTTAESYHAEKGESRTPIWMQLMDKRWWNMTNKIFRERTTRKWLEMLSKLGW